MTQYYPTSTSAAAAVWASGTSFPVSAMLLIYTYFFASYILLDVCQPFDSNTSKTKFLLIELKQQLDKINSCLLDTVHSTHNLGFISDEHLTSF